jgi:hypothetical protein
MLTRLFWCCCCYFHSAAVCNGCITERILIRRPIISRLWQKSIILYYIEQVWNETIIWHISWVLQMRFVRQALQNQLLCSSTIIMSRDVLFFSWYIKIVCALIVSKVLSLPKNSSKFSLFDFLPCSSSLDAGKVRQDACRPIAAFGVIFRITSGFLKHFQGQTRRFRDYTRRILELIINFIEASKKFSIKCHNI